MRIINLDAFMTCPPGTLYQKYEPCNFGDINVKYDSLGEAPYTDFVHQALTEVVGAKDSGHYVELLDEAQEKGTAFSFDYDLAGRDGLFKKEQLFAVYEQADIDKLVAFLGTCKGYETPTAETKVARCAYCLEELPGYTTYCSSLCADEED